MKIVVYLLSSIYYNFTNYESPSFPLPFKPYLFDLLSHTGTKWSNSKIGRLNFDFDTSKFSENSQ